LISREKEEKRREEKRREEKRRERTLAEAQRSGGRMRVRES